MRFAFAALSGCLTASLIIAGCGLDGGFDGAIYEPGNDGGGTTLIDSGGATLADSGNAGVDSGRALPKDADVPDVLVDAGPPPPPAPCSVAPGACVAAIPLNWSLVTYQASQATACAAPFTQADVVSNPVPGSGACGCGCTVNTAPVCDQGTLAFSISNGGNDMCKSDGATVTVAGAACQHFANGIGLADHTKATAIAPSGGTCTANASANAAAVTTTPGRVCTPPSTCQEQLCDSDGGTGGYAVCIATNGAPGSCPTGWGTSPVVVGTATALSCTNACTCDVNAGSSCSNAKLAVRPRSR